MGESSGVGWKEVLNAGCGKGVGVEEGEEEGVLLLAVTVGRDGEE
jgi:hypothetical protein